MERQSVYTDSFSHHNPIPAGCRMGNFFITGAITGRDPATGALAETLEQQCALIFAHMREIMHSAGGGIEHIVKVTVWHNGVFTDRDSRGVLNAEWLKMFPDAARRPARHTVQSDLGPGHFVMFDMMAIIGGGP
jgi:2-iminobutanoate/2-iminopropanoate deaminase